MAPRLPAAEHLVLSQIDSHRFECSVSFADVNPLKIGVVVGVLDVFLNRGRESPIGVAVVSSGFRAVTKLILLPGLQFVGRAINAARIYVGTKYPGMW
jgi:hypothetical protein